MRNFKLTIEYDGTDFNGWQIQGNGQRTIQGEIEKALSRIFKKTVKVHGSGRTDSGVHALGQVAHFKIETDKTPREILFAVNANVPKDISISHIEDVPLAFHAQYSVKNKTYRYRILNRSTRSAHLREFTYFYPHRLNMSLMKKEAQSLIGKHDFKAFTSLESARIKDGKSRGTIRTIKNLKISKKGPLILVDIEADGFLYKMVRNITGTLLDIAAGKINPDDIPAILRAKNRRCAGASAPPQGLFLMEVKY